MNLVIGLVVGLLVGWNVKMPKVVKHWQDVVVNTAKKVKKLLVK